MIVIIDYGMGNLGSIYNMIKKLGYNSVISSDIELIQQATKLVLPGVGAFDNGINNLNKYGIVPVLEKQVIEKKVPILGICLGMQLLTNSSEEGNCKGLGWINASTIRFKFEDSKMKVPHMGWNYVNIVRNNELFNDNTNESRFYFVHSYYVVCHSPNDVVTTTKYGHDFTSSFQHENIYGTQFHPEKSHKFGMKIFENFLKLV